MIVTPVKTKPLVASELSIFEVLDEAIHELHEQEIVVVTSKIIALCEGNVVPLGSIDKEDLIRQEADLYTTPPASDQASGYHYTIINNTFNFAAGIDESNANGNYILWPKDPQASANEIRQYLLKRFKLQHIGVIVTDSTISLSRWGTLGIAIAHSGFLANKNYIGTPDIFGRILHLSKANVAGGLAAAAVLCMGEGAELTPIAIIGDLPFVEYQDSDPTPEQLAAYYVSPLEDVPFAPFFKSLPWQKGKRANQ